MSPPSVVQNNAAAKTAVVPPFDLAVLLLLLGFAVMYLPTYYTLSQSAWGTDANGHGPMILGLCFWLLWRERKEILAPAPAAPVAGAVFLLLALACYVVGRSQALDTLEAFASFHGPDFYRLPRNTDRITLVREPWTLPAALGEGATALVPLRAGTGLAWRLQA